MCFWLYDNVAFCLRVTCWSGLRGKINRTAQLCSIVQHYVVAQFLEAFTRIGFCLTGPISLSLIQFVYVHFVSLLYVVLL